MIKHGTTAWGRQRFRCKACSSTLTRRNDIHARDLAAFVDYVTGRTRYADMPGQGRNARRRFASFWPLWPLSPLVDEVHHVVFVDGIYLSGKLVVLIACTKTHVVGWYVARGENSASWAALFSRIAPPDVVVCDGGSGIASAVAKTWPTTRIQRCTFHAFSTIKRTTTTRPRTNAGVELYGLARALLTIQTREESVAWLGELTAWNDRWQTFLAQQTRLPSGTYVPTHGRLIQARNSINTLARKGTLFTYLEPDLQVAGEPIPATNNQIEGGINTRLRALLREHRGMPLDHQIKTVLWWCDRHTENPASPAHLLAITVTDTQIAELFATAHHRTHAQNTINRWGTGVNWTDFHHTGTWHNTY